MQLLKVGVSLPQWQFKTVPGNTGWAAHWCRASLSHLTRLMFGFCISLEVLFFFLRQTWPVAERSATLLYALSRGVEYFGAAIFLAEDVLLSFKRLQQNKWDSGIASWCEYLPSSLSFWKIRIFPLPWSYTAFKAFYIMLYKFPSHFDLD